jgi:ATPase family associated with various cellular activities (AAA)
MLASNQISEFWSKERRKYPGAEMIFVIEDAEHLLLDRAKSEDTAVSSILNLTDGFMSDLVRIHLVCTINCDVDSIDEAILRPGRQKSFKEFTLLAYPQAIRLASTLGFELPEERAYSLAEIYHFRHSKTDPPLLTRQVRTVGFGA